MVQAAVAPRPPQVEPSPTPAPRISPARGRLTIPHVHAVSSALAAALLTLVCWPVANILPFAGSDESWKAALLMAANDHMHWGRDLVFTYGPLGWLPYPQAFFGNLLVVSWLYVLVLEFALALLLVVSLRAVVGLAPAALIAFAAMPVISTNMTEVAPLIALGVACLAIEGRLGRVTPAVAPALAAFAALQLLIKFSDGPVCLGLAMLTAIALGEHRLRHVGTAICTFVVALLALWLALGQSLGDVPLWLRGAISVTEGYTGAMSVTQPGVQWQYVAALVGTVAVGGLLWLHTAAMARARRWCLLLCFAGVGYEYFKEGFVRQDIGHTAIFFAAIVTMALVPAWGRNLRIAAYATALLLGLAIFQSLPIVTPSTWNGAMNLQRFGVAAQLLSSGDSRRAVVRSARERVEGQLHVAPALIAALRGRTVDVLPYEATAAWAYDLDWRPLPVFQDYGAYTAYLDQRNADALAGSRAPERLLRQHVAPLDNRFESFEAPRTYLSVLCRYAQVSAIGRWQVVTRVPDRCGTPRRIGEQIVRAGMPVDVPRAGGSDVVYAELHVSSSPLANLGVAIFKLVTLPQITVDGVSHRLVTSIAGGPGVLRVPASLGYSKGFGGELAIRRISVEHVSGPIRVDFYAVHVDPPRAPAG
jgi:hypothetical protein